MKKIYDAPEMLMLSLMLNDDTNNGEYDVLSMPISGDDEDGADGGEEF